MISEFSYFTCHYKHEHGDMHVLSVHEIVQRHCDGKSAGDNSSVLFVFESCVLLHAMVCFSAGDDHRKNIELCMSYFFMQLYEETFTVTLSASLFLH